MTKDEALKILKETDHRIVTLNHISATLGWDLETVMPAKGDEERGEQLALLSSLVHKEKTSKVLEEAIAAIDGEKLSVEESALLRVWKKEMRTAVKLPASFVERLTLTTNKAHSHWAEVREKSDFSIFSDTLSELVSLEKEMASIIGDGSYDSLLDLYLDNLGVKELDGIFGDLENSIHYIMDRCDSSIDDGFLYKPYDEKKLHEFSIDLIDRMGFDHSRAAVGLTLHPFTTTLGSDDVRISTRYSDASLADPIFSIIHECGHSFYELYSTLNDKIKGSSLAGGLYMDLHESQSRLFENLIGRDEHFWVYFYPRLQEKIPHLRSVSLDSFVRAINKSQSSAIRVNADELTYSLHIILRYKIEKMLIDESLPVKELPDLWRELSSSIIRYDIKNDSEGVLQDSHWAGGSFGYFPSYAIGNIYSVMIFNKMKETLGGDDRFNSLLERGEFNEILSFLDKNIWRNGSIYTPSEVLETMTGSKIDVKPYKEYLLHKFAE